MAEKPTILAQIASLLADNNVGGISPEDLRTVFNLDVNSTFNLDDTTSQTVAGPVNFSTIPTVQGTDVVADAPEDGYNYIRVDGEWSRKAAILTTSNTTVTVNTSATDPSYLVMDNAVSNVGITLSDPATGTYRNDTGRIIKHMTGTLSFYPDVTGPQDRRMVIVSEKSLDGVTWAGNINTIRKVEVVGDTESFKTVLSLWTDLQVGEYFRFRVYDEEGVGLDLIPTAEVILGQSFTGPSVVLAVQEE